MASTALRPVSGLYGDLEPVAGGSFVLEPPERASNAKVVHFIGGAFVGAAGQLTYRYLLERVAASGFMVVATPYRLSFDYASVCDAIEESFRAAMETLNMTENAEIIGVGHSCGALLHTLLASRDEMGRATRRRLALLSYNNKGASDAVPLFESLIVPLATEAMRDDDGSPAPILREALEALRGAADSALALAESDETLARFAPPAVAQVANLARREVIPIARQSLEVADQLPDLLREVADGARDFEPKPSEVRQILRGSNFRARDTLIVQFETDAIDESDDLYAVLRDNARNRGPQAAKPRLSIKRLPGTHLTPLTQDIFLPASAVASLAQARDITDPALTLFRDRWLGEVDTLYQQLENWLLDDYSQGVPVN